MRNKDLLKKGIYAFTTAAFVAAMGFAVDADAATIDPAQISVDSQAQTLTVSPNGDTQVLVGFGTSKKQGDKDVVAIKSTDWDVHDVSGGSVKVDLSSIKPAKDAYVQVKGNKNDDPLTIKIAASNQSLKANKPDYSTDNPTVTFKNNIEGESYEFRTAANDKWEAFNSGTTDLTSYIDRGATLYVRTKGSGNGAIAQSNASNVVYPDKSSEISSPVYDKAGDAAIAFAGKETKLSIAKRANAPKLAADYAKGLLSLPKNTLARILKSADDYSVNVPWTESGTTDQKNKAEITVGTEKIKFGDNTDKILEAKTVNTAAKPASRVASLKVPAIETVYTRQGGAASTVSGGSIDNAELHEISGGALKVKAESDPKYTPEKGGKIKFTNSDPNYGFEIAMVEKEEDIASLTKFTSLKAGANKTANLSTKKTDVGNHVYIRRAGDKKKALWPTKWVYLGSVGIDTVLEGDNPADPSEDQKVFTIKDGDTEITNNGTITFSASGASSKTLTYSNAAGNVTAEASGNVYSASVSDGTITITGDRPRQGDSSVLTISDGTTTLTVNITTTA
jgi:hypothetical protein